MTKKMTERLHLTLPKKLDEKLKKLGDEMGIGKCGLIRVAIKFYFDYREGFKNASKLPEINGMQVLL